VHIPYPPRPTGHPSLEGIFCGRFATTSPKEKQFPSKEGRSEAEGWVKRADKIIVKDLT